MVLLGAISGLLFSVWSALLPVFRQSSLPLVSSISLPTEVPTVFPESATHSYVGQSTTTNTSAYSPVVSAAVVLPTPPATVMLVAQIDQDTLQQNVRAALVNLLCTTRGGGYFNPISGSGVVIDSRGIILTNAHVAQYFLLRDYPTADSVECVVRVGSPAAPRYTARLLYLPPDWVKENVSKIVEREPTATGENDFALLYISGTTSGTELPAAFPYLPVAPAAPSTGVGMLLTAYPAGFLEGIAIQTNLYATAAYATVGQLFTFNDPDNVDLFSVGGTVVSQGGSSGGAAVRTDTGALAGIITTETVSPTTSGRDLRAITIAHIDRVLRKDGMGGLEQFISGNILTLADTFNTHVAPLEFALFKSVLDKR